MGRHADPDPTPFRRSVLRAAARGIVALLAVCALVVVLSLVGREGGPGPVIVVDEPPQPVVTPD